MSTKHTPGPWHSASDEPWGGTEPTGIFSGTWDAKKGWQTSEQVWPPYCCDPASDKFARHVADLRLMASAPELLAALHVAKHYVDCHDMATADEKTREDLEVIRAAIDKAEGR